jgi:oligosaccharide repeat unit polymerase
MTDTSAAAYVAMNALGFGIAIALLRSIRARSGEWLNFALVFSALWGLNLLVGQVALGGRLRPDLSTLAILFGAWWLFLLGALWPLRRGRATVAPMPVVNGISGVTVMVVLIVLQLAAFAFEVGSQQLSVTTFFSNLWRIGADLRTSDVYASVEYPFSFSIWRWDHVLYIPLAFYLHANRLISAKVVLAVMSVAILMAFGRYTRAPVIQVAVVSLVSWVSLYRPGLKWKLMVGGAVGSIMVLAFVASQVNLIESVAPGATSPLESVLSYIGGSPLAYQRLLQGTVPTESGVVYTLEAVNYGLYKLSIIHDYTGVVRPYADTAMTTNVYTFLDAYTIDAGLAGALLGALVTGALVAFVYRRVSTQPNYANLAVYSYLTYCCVMAAANNEFIRAGMFINLALAWLIGRLIRTHPPRARRVTRLV